MLVVCDRSFEKETFGSEDDPPLLLVMGLGTQMLGWHEDFCQQLAERLPAA